jgi:hypothetical protein
MDSKARKNQPAKQAADWAVAFLKVLRLTGNLTTACCRVGVQKEAVYSRMEKDQAFARAFDEACELAIEDLEAEARKRALSGSDKLLMFLLRAHKPELYGERSTLVHDGQVRTVVSVEDLSDEELAKIAGCDQSGERGGGAASTQGSSS